MWILLAFGSAVFAGMTAILSKIGIRNTDSNVATALRTVVVLLFSWLMVLIVGSGETLSAVSGRTFAFLILSGLSTGASWLCYFRALQLGPVNKVAPIDKSSTILTMLLAFVFLSESLTLLKAAAVALIGAGTWLMIKKAEEKVPDADAKGGPWLAYAFGAAVFASLTAILGKIGIEGIESNLGTAIRTAVVLVMAWVVVFVTKKGDTVRHIDRRSWTFLILSGFATGASWLCYYRALQMGPASVVVPIDKLSILFTVAFSYRFLNEKLSARAAAGLGMIVLGTLSLLL